MLAAYLHGLWLGNLVRSSLRRDVAFSPSFLQKAVRVSQLDIKGASISCRERGHVRTATKQGPDSHGLTFEQGWH
jgi:hypothetical protein